MSLPQEALFLTTASAAVLALALLFCLALRKGSATLRGRLLAAAFLIVLALPLVMTQLPRPVRIADLEWAPGRVEAGGSGEQFATMPASLGVGTVESGTPRAQPEVSASGPLAPPAGLPPAQPAGPSAHLLAFLAAALAALWLGVAALGLHRLIRVHAKARHLARAAVAIDNKVLLDLHTRLCREHGRHRPIRLLRSPRVPGPLTVGLLRARILLPQAAESWTTADTEVEAILRHEIAHVVRRDNLMNLAASIVAILHWFDPLAWLALTRLRREAELACDDAVLRGGVRPSAYARILLAHARQPARHNGRFAIEPTVPFACHAERRLRLLLAAKVNRTRPGRLATAAFTILLMAVTLPLTSLRTPVPIRAADARAAGGPAAAASRHPAAAGWTFLLPASLKNDIKTSFDEMAAEIREGRALNAWRENPALGTPLPEGLTEIPADSLTVEVHDALALRGSKYGCIFTSDDGYVRARWRDGDSAIHLTLKPVPHPEASDADLWLDSLAGLFGAGQDGEFRAYSITRRHDGIRTSFEDRTRLEMQAVIAALITHMQQTEADDPARSEDPAEDES
jgi:beta-lactamase regulating signal transducer with metallopeptidase domain